jgi:hypothetical protein
MRKHAPTAGDRDDLMDSPFSPALAPSPAELASADRDLLYAEIAEDIEEMRQALRGLCSEADVADRLANVPAGRLRALWRHLSAALEILD